MTQYVSYCALIVLSSVIAIGMLAIYEDTLKSEERGNVTFPKRVDEVIRKNKTVWIGMVTTDILELIMAVSYYKLVPDTVIITLCLSTLMWPVALIDYKEHLIPNQMLAVLLAVRIIILIFEIIFLPNQVLSILVSGFIAALGMMFAAVLCRLIFPASVGMGDVKLLGIVGIYMGIDKMSGVMFPALVIMFFYSVYLLLSKKATRMTEIAFAPFVLSGIVVGAVLMGI